MSIPRNDTSARRRHGDGYLWSFGFFAAVAVFLVAPILVTASVSFTNDTFIAFPPQGFSLRWYGELLSNRDWRTAIVNTLLIGGGCAVFATAIGTMAAYGISKIENRLLRDSILILFLAPLAVPYMSLGMSMYPVFAKMGLIGTKLGVAAAQSILAIPFVVLAVTSTIRRRDQVLEKCARTLGASPLQAFWHVSLPLLLPGVIAGAILAFMTSFDDVVMPMFLGGFNAGTVPKVMLDSLTLRSDPSVMAASTGISVVGLALFLLLTFVTRRRFA
jgi:ABC-type spermidine/putrescine transport system permease subunit II